MASRPYALVTASLTAQNTFSDAGQFKGHFNVSVSGTNGHTTHLQRSFDGSTWLDVTSYTADAEDVHFEPETGVVYRIGVKTGNFGTGTLSLRLSQ